MNEYLKEKCMRFKELMNVQLRKENKYLGKWDEFYFNEIYFFLK